MWKIAVDAMGGDHAPEQIIKGALDALSDNSDIEIIFTGSRDVIKKYGVKEDNRVKIINTTQEISNNEDALKAIREKSDSSLIVGLNLVKSGDADAFITAGSTGAFMSGALFNVGRIKGIHRPALAPILPTKTGRAILIDCGANADVKDEYLAQFALMGSVYMENVLGVKNPRVGLVNIGAEEKKGNEQYRRVHQLLKNTPDINFIGNAEARDCLAGVADVLVCDGFTGNILLKSTEGTANYIMGLLKAELTKNLFRKLAALTLKGAFKAIKGSLDYREYGGAPLLGINGCVIKAHGSSNAYAFSKAVEQAINYLDGNVAGVIKSRIENM